MPDILLRDIPESTLNILKQRAKKNRRSLQQELLTILETTAEGTLVPTRAQVAAAIRARLERGGRRFGDSTDLVREDRNR